MPIPKQQEVVAFPILRVDQDTVQQGYALDVKPYYRASLRIRIGRAGDTPFTVRPLIRVEGSYLDVPLADDWTTLTEFPVDVGVNVASQPISAAEVPGNTDMGVPATTNFSAGDYVFLHNPSLAESEWARIKSISGTDLQIEEGIVRTQTGSTVRDQAYQRVLNLDLTTYQRLRLVVNMIGCGQPMVVQADLGAWGDVAEAPGGLPPPITPPPVDPPDPPPPDATYLQPSALPALTGPLSAQTMGALEVYPQYEKLNIIWNFTGDDAQTANCFARFRVASGPGPWRQFMGVDEPLRGELARVYDPNGTERFYAGCALDLTPNTVYDIELTVRDGNLGQVNSFQATTLAFPADKTTLIPTRYVATNGNDASAGTSWATAWKTLEKVRTTAPAGAVVMIGPGHYVKPTAAFTQRITLRGELPCLNANRTPVSAAQQTVIYSGTQTAPGTGAWTQVTPDGNGAHPVWTRDIGVSNPIAGGFHVARNDCPTRISRWETSAQMDTAAEWANLVWTCDAYNAGYHCEGTVVWLKLPSNAPLGMNPNSYYITFGAGALLTLNADDSRLCDLVLVGGDSCITPNGADRVIIDGCITRLAHDHIEPQSLAELTTVQNCLMEERGLYSQATGAVDPTVVPWGGIKVRLTTGNGATDIGSKPLVSCENGGFVSRFGRLGVIRDTTVDGLFNGIGAYCINLPKENGFGVHAYRIQFRNVADDCFEPEYSISCWACHDIDISHCLVGISIAPIHYGPIYFYRFLCGPVFKPLQIIPPGSPAFGSPIGIKDSAASGGPSNPRPTMWLVHSVFYCPLMPGNIGMSTWEAYDNPGDGKEPLWVAYNNIFWGSRYAAGMPPTQRNTTNWPYNHAQVRDYNQFYSSDPTRGNKVYTTGYNTWTSYRNAVGACDANSNKLTGGATLEFHDTIASQFVNVGARDFHLTASATLAMGTPVGNISDIVGGTSKKGIYP